MSFFFLALLVVTVIVAAVLWALLRDNRSPRPGAKPSPPEPDYPEAAVRGAGSRETGPPSAGQGLQALQARLADMPTEALESMLETGATFKPGAEDLIRDELARRRAPE